MESQNILLATFVALSLFYTVSSDIITPKTPLCPDIECMSPCNYGFERDAKGCSTCMCLEAECQGFKCEEGKDCRVFLDTSSSSNVPKCVDISLPSQCQSPIDVGPCRARKIKWFYDTDSDMCQEFTYGGCKGNHNRFENMEQCVKACKSCPVVSVSACGLHCDHGYKRGEDGCEICECKPAPVEDRSTEFKVRPGCDNSEERECDISCPTGYKQDKAGCDICECRPPAYCEDKNCAPCEHGYREDDQGCPTCECRAKGECRKETCYMYCEFGRKLDRYDCPRCECKDDPCTTMDCPDGKQCRTLNGTTECIAIVPQWIEGCPSIMCAMYCQHGYYSDRYGCNVCKCKSQVGPECAMMKCKPCEPDYGYVFTEYGCRTCECHENPCMDHRCTVGTVCVADKQCPACSTRPTCVPMKDIRQILVHLKLKYLDLPKDFNRQTFAHYLKKQLSERLRLDESHFTKLQVSDPVDSNLNIDFHLLNENDNAEELHHAVKSLEGAQEFNYGVTSFSSDPTAYSNTFYKVAGNPDTGESKSGHTTYIIIGCVVGGLLALMIGIAIAMAVTKGRNKKPKANTRKHNVVYQPTTYEDNNA